MNKPIQRIAAIHDLSGFGRVSLTTVIPILSSMGMQVCPLPTAVLSTHTAYKNFHFVDLTNHMQQMIEHWKTVNPDFDAIYSGFLGSSEQVEIVIDFIDAFADENKLIVVDPVMGDNGKPYKTFGKDMINEMKKLVTHADVITPNLTEAALLLDKPYTEDLTNQDLKDWLTGLSQMGPDVVILTSVPALPKGKRTAVAAYNKKDNRFWKVSCDYIPAFYPGTGDSFTSVITGSLLQGDSLPVALDRAVNFISIAIRSTFGYNIDPKEGIMLEKVLDTLKAPVQLSTYELLD